MILYQIVSDTEMIDYDDSNLLFQSQDLKLILKILKDLKSDLRDPYETIKVNKIELQTVQKINFDWLFFVKEDKITVCTQKYGSALSEEDYLDELDPELKVYVISAPSYKAAKKLLDKRMKK